MRRIFRDAHLTIVAACATKVSEGFLQNRPPTSPPDIPLSFQLPDRRVGTFLLSMLWKYDPDPDKEWGEEYNPSTEPVSKRGWCLQECLLAPRALFFATHTLQYHCQTSLVNVGGAYHSWTQKRRLPNIIFDLDTDSGVTSPATPRPTLSPEEWVTTREGWFDALSDYTQRSVTVSDDKLVAFAGIAEQFYRIWRTPYLAGLWQDTLFEDLFWHKRPATSTSLPRPAKYRAPSWSWASVDGGVEAALSKWKTSDKQSGRCEIVRCEVILANTQLPFGQVTAGTLVIRATLVKATWARRERELYVYSLTYDDVLEDPGSDRSSGSSHELECIGTAWIDSSDDAHVREIWAVALMWTKPVHMTGMILALAEPGATATDQPRYRRIGFLRTHATAEGLDWVDRTEPTEIVII